MSKAIDCRCEAGVMMEPPQCKAEYKCPEQRHIYDGSKEVGGLERYIAGEMGKRGT